MNFFLYLIKFFLITIPYTFYKVIKLLFPRKTINSKIPENTVFIGGFFDYNFRNFPLTPYWGYLGFNFNWYPDIGLISSSDDCSSELFYSIMGQETIIYEHETESDNNFHSPVKLSQKYSQFYINFIYYLKKFFDWVFIDKTLGNVDRPKIWDNDHPLTLVGYSMGATAVTTLLRKLDKHWKALNNINGGKLFFFKDVERKNPYYIGPQSIKNIVTISAPLGGLNYAVSGMKLSFDEHGELYIQKFSMLYYFGLIIIALNYLIKKIMFLPNVNLDQSNNLHDFFTTSDLFCNNLGEHRSKLLMDETLKIIEDNKINHLRLVTHASISVSVNGNNIYLMDHTKSLLILLTGLIAGVGITTDYQQIPSLRDDAYTINPEHHDGIVPISSQLYKYKCDCKDIGISEDFYKCSVCKTIYVYCEHTQIAGIYDILEDGVEKAYISMFDWISSTN